MEAVEIAEQIEIEKLVELVVASVYPLKNIFLLALLCSPFVCVCGLIRRILCGVVG